MSPFTREQMDLDSEEARFFGRVNDQGSSPPPTKRPRPDKEGYSTHPMIKGKGKGKKGKGQRQIARPSTDLGLHQWSGTTHGQPKPRASHTGTTSGRRDTITSTCRT